jgi:hypothetical protein
VTRLVQQLETENGRGALPFVLRMSIGSVESDPHQPQRLEDLMAYADRIMYEQKARKRAERSATSPSLT